MSGESGARLEERAVPHYPSQSAFGCEFLVRFASLRSRFTSNNDLEVIILTWNESVSLYLQMTWRKKRVKSH